MPISTRSADDGALGNQVAAAMIGLPVGMVDPVERMKRVHEIVLGARYEPAMEVLSGAANILVHLPDRLMTGPLAQLVKIDVGVSQVRGLLEPSYLAGAQIMRTYGLGPHTGLAAFIGMMTHLDVCCIGVHADPAAVTDPELFLRCLAEGFDEVLAVGRPARRASAPAGTQRRSAASQPRRPRRVAVNVLDDLRGRWNRQRAATGERAAAIDAIRTSDRFERGIHELAERLGRDRRRRRADAARYLDEMVTVHSDAVPDFNLVLSRIVDKHAFEGVVQYDERAVERLRAFNEVSPLVMMTGHRSYLDFVVRVPFARRGFEREFRFAGANILFWPMGPIGHSAGIIYIRRGFRDPVYPFVLRQYVGWLTEQRANFLWAIEGGRTRTGKLMRPKAGLLAYVADAFVDGRTPDVMLVPATVIYEYLDEVFEYARYGRGATKRAESISLPFRLTREQRTCPRRGTNPCGYRRAGVARRVRRPLGRRRPSGVLELDRTGGDRGVPAHRGGDADHRRRARRLGIARAGRRSPPRRRAGRLAASDRRRDRATRAAGLRARHR